MQPNAAGMAKMRENVVLRFRRDLADIMHEHFEFFVEHTPEEMSKLLPLSGSEVADLVEVAQHLRQQVQKAWTNIVVIDETGRKMQMGFEALRTELEPSRMTTRQTDIVNFIIRHAQILLGHDDPEAAELGIPYEGIFPNLRGDRIVAWAQGRVPDTEVRREMARRARTKRPMSDQEIAAMLRDKWDAGWRPDVNAWIARWLRTIYITIYRTYFACFEYTMHIRIRYMRLDQKQSDAFLDMPNPQVADGIREAVYADAQRMADEKGLHVQIVDKQGNILGEKMPSQEIEKYVAQLAVRRGKASRGDWSRRKQLAAYTKNADEEMDFERMVLAEWGQLL